MKSEERNAPPPVDPKDYYSVMVHFYRGELGRSMTWRQRLDVTTNWAVLGTSAMITFALGSRENTHLIFMFANYLGLLLLSIEARRYRYYDAFRARVRMLEAHFLMPVLMREVRMLQGDWKKVMAEDLLIPSFKISRVQAVVRRYRRNYLWIFFLIACAWYVKIWIHYPDSHSFRGFFATLGSHHPVPQYVFWPVFCATYLLLLVLTVLSFTEDAGAGEFAIKAMHRKRWLR